MQELDRKLDDISEIRAMMERSAKFLSLSGLSGIGAGCVALIGSLVAWYFMADRGGYAPNDPAIQQFLVIDAGAILVLALITSLFFTRRMALRKGLPVWNKTGRYLLAALAVPIGTGALVSIILSMQHLFAYAVPATLIFYGLGLTDGSKFTVREIWYLGVAEILLGVFGMLMPLLAPWLWAAGFGVLHIVYGVVMYFRYER